MRLNKSVEFVIGGYTRGGRTFDVIVIGIRITRCTEHR
jgi:hypothetical protein